jgi:COP9 signalosome complex subunit 4
VLGERTVAFEEQVSSLLFFNPRFSSLNLTSQKISSVREALADLYQQQENWSEAAATLKGIPLESGTRQVPDDYKLKIYIKIVRLYLEDEDSTSADAFLNRAAMLNPTDKANIIQLTACQAKSLDFKRQFVPSALKYLDLSYTPELADSERMEALISAVICTILAGAGPQRSRLLATLFKDERVREREEVQRDGVASILEKMFLGSLVKREQVEMMMMIIIGTRICF